jgi:hypothetical protein
MSEVVRRINRVTHLIAHDHTSGYLEAPLVFRSSDQIRIQARQDEQIWYDIR